MLLVYEADGNNKRVCACMKQSEWAESVELTTVRILWARIRHQPKIGNETREALLIDSLDSIHLIVGIPYRMGHNTGVVCISAYIPSTSTRFQMVLVTCVDRSVLRMCHQRTEQ
jgi:hypothetical protein